MPDIIQATGASLDPKALAAQAAQAEQEEKQQEYRVRWYEQQIQVMRVFLSRMRPPMPAKDPADDMLTPLIIFAGRAAVEMNVSLADVTAGLASVYEKHTEMLAKGKEIQEKQQADLAAKDAATKDDVAA